MNDKLSFDFCEALEKGVGASFDIQPQYLNISVIVF